MFRCECCNHEFEYSEMERELLGEFYMGVNSCPYCHSDAILKSVGEDAFGDYVYPGDTYYDIDCQMVLRDNIEKYLMDCEVEA